jgi:transposase
MGHSNIAPDEAQRGEVLLPERPTHRSAMGKLFFCPVCHYEANADFNASVNPSFATEQ